MDADLVLIFAFVIVITTVLGLTINGVVGKILDYKRDKAGIPRPGMPPRRPESVSDERTELIEDRLRVLERLATDKGTLLSDEIDALRDDVKLRREKEDS
jgi:hypothetical protein